MNIANNLSSKALIITVLLLNINTFGFSQENIEKKDGLDNGTISTQFDYIIKKSESYETYQVIKKTWLHKIKNNTLDSIKGLKNDIQSLETKNKTQLNEINSLKTELNESTNKLEFATKEKDSFSFLGILLSKKTYNLIVWSLIFILTIALLVMTFLFKRSYSITKKTKEDLVDKQNEFDAHRKWALEREQSLARELNKLKQKYKGLD